MAIAALSPFDTKTRFGQHQQFFVMGVDVDRTSLAQVRVEMHVSDEGCNNFDTNALSLGYGLGVAQEIGVTDLLDVPEDIPEAICVGINRRYDNDGSMGIYTYIFEGLLQNRVPFFMYELEFAMNQEPIETHPNFSEFEPKYGPYNPIDRTWPRVPTAKQATAGGLGGTANAAQAVTNPMFGVSSFLSPGAVWRVSYTATELTAEIFNGIGSTDEPDGLDQFEDFANAIEASQRNWLKMAPRIVKRGGAFQITLEWMLSGPRGFMGDIYDQENLEKAPGSGSGTATANPGGGGSGPVGPGTAHPTFLA